MIRLSRLPQYKHLVFKLAGRGEEPEDMWVAYFKNGKIQMERAIITSGEFDEDKLR